MTGAEYKAAREALGLTQQAFADALNRNRVTVADREGKLEVDREAEYALRWLEHTHTGDTMTYEIRYQGSPHGTGTEHTESTHATPGAVAHAWLGMGPALRRERALVEVTPDGTERALLVEHGKDWLSLQYADGGTLHTERIKVRR